MSNKFQSVKKDSRCSVTPKDCLRKLQQSFAGRVEARCGCVMCIDAGRRQKPAPNVVRKTWCVRVMSHGFTLIHSFGNLNQVDELQVFFLFFLSNYFLREFPEIFTVKGSNPGGAPCAAPQPESRSDEPLC